MNIIPRYVFDLDHISYAYNHSQEERESNMCVGVYEIMASHDSEEKILHTMKAGEINMSYKKERSLREFIEELEEGLERLTKKK